MSSSQSSHLVDRRGVDVVKPILNHCHCHRRCSQNHPLEVYWIYHDLSHYWDYWTPEKPANLSVMPIAKVEAMGMSYDFMWLSDTLSMVLWCFMILYSSIVDCTYTIPSYSSIIDHTILVHTSTRLDFSTPPVNPGGPLCICRQQRGGWYGRATPGESLCAAPKTFGKPIFDQ
jgi:hypothetical protein